MNRMTDNEIIKNLVCCMESECDNCQYQYDTACKEYIFHDCLKLIHNLMNKNTALQHCYDECLKDLKNANAEIERLESEIDKQYEIAEANVRAEIASGGTSCHWCEDKVRAEAIKEFAERLKAELEIEDNEDWFEITEHGLVSEIDNLVKEMVGAESG